MPWSRRRVGREVLARLKRLAVLVALELIVAATGLVQAQARTLSAHAAEMSGFGRLALEFDQPTKVKTKLANGILVIAFSAPVSIAGERLVREAPAYLAQVRQDPDGTGLRVALTQPYRVNVLEAGEKVFIDLLPASWTGLPPGLPPDVVEALARRAQEAEAKAREEERRRVQRAVRLKVVHLPTLVRLVVEVPASVPVAFASAGGVAELDINAFARLEAGDARTQAGEAEREISADASTQSLKIKLALGDRYEAKGFRDEDAFLIDLAKPAPAIPPPQLGGSAAPDAGRLGASGRASEVELRKPAAPSPTLPERSATEKAKAEPSGPGHSPSAAPGDPGVPVRATATATAEGLSIAFPFRLPTAAAAFERGGVVTAVFHTPSMVELTPLPSSAAAFASLGPVAREGAFTLVGLKLAAGNLVRLSPQENGWVLSIGETGSVPSEPLAAQRSADGAGRTVLTVPLLNASGVHWIDAAPGERIAVATAYGPPKGVPKPQQFVEFRLLPSAHGVAVLSEADDLLVRSGVDGVTIGRPTGLALSLPEGSAGGDRADAAAPVISRKGWLADRTGSPIERRNELVGAVAASAPSARSAARLDLARFLIANGLNVEGAGVLSAAAKDDPALLRRREFLLLQGVALARMRREREARTVLANDVVAEDPEAALWRAWLDARTRQWSAALVGFRRSSTTLELYPAELQAPLRIAAARAAVEMKDAGYAEAQLGAASRLASDQRAADQITLMRARIDEASGAVESALESYRKLRDADDEPVAAEAALHWIALGLRQGTLKPEGAIAHLERLAVSWRGDEIEIAALGRLGRIYAEAGRWRDAFMVTRRADRAFPNHEITRALHEDTARLFEELFLSGKAETLSRVETLALYFDFKELTPIGRRGDEIVRRLADRLVELDLLNRAGDLLQHQVEHRLGGAARATIAARLATIRLMDGKPQQALQAIQSTRLPELPVSTKRARMLLEARALSDLSRTDLALEVLQSESGAEIDRLRGDILWSGRRWREAGEAHERLVGARWQAPEPLDDRERTDVMRAAIAYALGNEALALDRLRSKFAAKMADSADARTFAFLTQPNAASTRAFRDAARGATNADTLADFLAEYRKRYPEAAAPERRGAGSGPAAPADEPAKPQAQASAPARG